MVDCPSTRKSGRQILVRISNFPPLGDSFQYMKGPSLTESIHTPHSGAVELAVPGTLDQFLLCMNELSSIIYNKGPKTYSETCENGRN